MEWPADNSYRAVRDWLLGYAVHADREAEAIVRTLLEWHTGKSRAELISGTVRFSESSLNRLKAAALQLQAGTPVQHITGEAWFYGRAFAIDRRALIPRPETEELVALLLPRILGKKRCLDVGTGSGCIAITLALELPFLEVDGWDISADALALAHLNAERLGASVNFQRCDVFAALPEAPYDVLVSNPPYIERDEAETLEVHVRNHEPEQALFVKHEPLEFYRHMVDRLRDWLTPNGVFGFECHTAHAAAVLELCLAAGCAEATLHNDAQGLPRMVVGVRPQ